MRVLFNVSFNKSKCSDELEKYSFPKLNQMIRHSSVKDVEGVDTYKARPMGRFLPTQETFHNSEARVCDNLKSAQAYCSEGRGGWQ